MRERSGWQLQPARDEDHRALLAAWIAADPDHAGRTTAEAWLASPNGVQNLLCVDREGALFFLRCSNAMRLDIQFAPPQGAAQVPGSHGECDPTTRSLGNVELRTVRTLRTGLPWLAFQFQKQGYRELIYESRSARLVRFLERIGFRASSTEHVLAL